MDHEDIYRIILARLGLAPQESGTKTFNLISSCYDRVGACGVLDRGTVFLYDRNRDFAFVLAEDLRSTANIEPTDTAVDGYRRILEARSRDLAAYDEAQEAVLSRLKGFGYI
jgi:hypothetical protein